MQQWIEGNAPNAEVVLAGSLGTGMTLEELKDISNDPKATAEAVKLDGLKLGMGTGQYGSDLPRERVAALYDQSKVSVTKDDVVSIDAASLYQAMITLIS